MYPEDIQVKLLIITCKVSNSNHHNFLNLQHFIVFFKIREFQNFCNWNLCLKITKSTDSDS